MLLTVLDPVLAKKYFHFCAGQRIRTMYYKIQSKLPLKRCLRPIGYSAIPWRSLVVGNECRIYPSRNQLCLCENPKLLQHMHVIIPKLLTVGLIQLFISLY